MGGRERTEALIASASASARNKAKMKSPDEAPNSNTDLEVTQKRMEEAWRRLVDEGSTGMGRLYKVMAIVPYLGTGSHGGKKQELRALAGFGDD